MALKLYEEASVQAIANAIRSKNGSSDSYTIGQMANEIESIHVDSTPDVMSTGYQYIELPLYDDDYPVIKARVRTLYTAVQAVYIGDVWSVDSFCFYIENGAPQFRYTTNNVDTISSPAFNRFVDIEMDYRAGTLKYNGTTYGGVQKTQLHNSIKLFGADNRYSIFAIEKMEIYKNNSLFINLVPQVNANGEGYLYDTIGQQAYFSATNIPLIHTGREGGGISEPLWDSSQIISGEYVNNNDGSFISDASGARSPLVEVTEDCITVFTASDWNNIYNAWYDASQVFISSFSLTRGSSNAGPLEVVTRPDNAKYVCLSNGVYAMQNIRAWEGDIT